MTRWIAAFWPAALWTVGLLALGARSDLSGPSTSLPLDKAAHFILYAVLGALLARGWRESGTRLHPALLIAAVALIGAADELNQRSVPGRSAELGDWIADAAGGAAGFIAATTVLARREERRGESDG